MDFEEYNLRFVKKEDAQEIREILGQNIIDSHINFQKNIPSKTEIEEKIEKIEKEYPFIVAYKRKKSKKLNLNFSILNFKLIFFFFIKISLRVVGYSYCSSFRFGDGYRFSAETSIYVHGDHQKRKISFALYQTLIKIMKCLGYKQLIAVIALPNTSSINLHLKFGFEFFAQLEKAGNKKNQQNIQWIDISFYRLVLSSFGDDRKILIISFYFLKNNFFFSF